MSRLYSAAHKDGWQAHSFGKQTNDNPYDKFIQAYSHAEWESGWCARFDALKHGTALIEELENIYY